MNRPPHYISEAKGGDTLYRLIILMLIAVPALEIWLLFTVGKLIGGLETFLFIILTGVFGAYLARRELRKVWNYAKYELAERRAPGASIIDGICVFVGGLLLLCPGFITDLVGLSLVIPLTRQLFRNAILAMLQKWISSGRFIMFRRY